VEVHANQSVRVDKQRRFWIKLWEEVKQKGVVLRGLPTEETIDQMLAEVHGFVVLQMVKPTGECVCMCAG
jgi:hypothetical protein